jgi:hypothetical protein
VPRVALSDLAEVDTLASQATSQAATGKVDQGVLKDLQAGLEEGKVRRIHRCSLMT